MKKKKVLLEELIERERKYCDQCEDGSDEYVKSTDRLVKLQEQLNAQKEGTGKLVVEGIKVVSGVVLPVFGWVVITAFEKEDTLTSALKKTIDCFIPRRL